MEVTPGTTTVDASSWHRDAWNRVAEKLGYTIRWSQDTGQVHKIDSYHDLTYTEADAEKFQINPRIPFERARRLQRVIDDINGILEAKRKEALKASLGVLKEVSTDPDLSTLTPAERECVRRLIGALPILDRLDVLLKDVRNPEFQKYLRDTKDDLGQKQFDRLGFNACSYATPEEHIPYCSPVDYFPNPKNTMDVLYPTVLVPDDLTEGDIVKMSLVHPDPLYNPYLSPMTEVWRDTYNPIGWGWRNLKDMPEFRDSLLQLALVIRHAANTPDLDQTLSEQLDSMADSLVSDNPYYWYEAEKGWALQGTGNLEINIGLSAGYSPMSKAYGATMMIGVVRDVKEEFHADEMTTRMQAMEDKMARLIGSEYEPRQGLKTESITRVVDYFAFTGRDGFVTLAFVAPTTGPYAKDGLAKRVIIANHQAAKAKEILLPLAELAFVPEQVPYVTANHFLMGSFAHEMTHPVGPRPDRKVKGDLTAQHSIGEDLFDILEELKSDVGGVVIVTDMATDGIEGWDAEYVKGVYVTAVASWVRQIRFGGRAHGGGAAVGLGYMFKEGALTVESVEIPGQGQQYRLRVNYDKILKAIEGLWADIGRAQATGSREQAEYLTKEIPAHIPETFDTILERINSSGIPVDVVMLYPDLKEKFSDTTTSKN